MDLTPEEMLLAAVLRRALKDAKEERNEKLRAEARWWLWWVAPSVAEQAAIPAPSLPAALAELW